MEAKNTLESICHGSSMARVAEVSVESRKPFSPCGRQVPEVQERQEVKQSPTANNHLPKMSNLAAPHLGVGNGMGGKHNRKHPMGFLRLVGIHQLGSVLGPWPVFMSLWSLVHQAIPSQNYDLTHMLSLCMD